MRSPPGDAWHGAYLIFFLQGIGQLFPWNVFINAEEYFSRRFCGSPFEKNFENCFTLGYNFSCILAFLLTLRYQDRFSIRGRVLGSLTASMLAFVACCIFVVAKGVSTGLLFTATMVFIITSGLATAILQGGLFAMASAFPPKYTQSMMAGQGLAGLTVALAGIFTTLVGPDDQSCILEDFDGVDSAKVPDAYSHREVTIQQPIQQAAQSAEAGQELLGVASSPSVCQPYEVDWSTFAYFGIAVAVLLACTATYPVLERLPLTSFYTQASTGSIGVSSEVVDGGGGGGCISGDGDCCVGGSDAGVSWRHYSSTVSDSNASPEASLNRHLVEAPRFQLLAPRNPLSDDASTMLEELVEGESVGGVYGSPTAGAGGAMNSLRVKLAPMSEFAFSVFVVFAVTLSVFPGATSQIVSSRQCQPGRARFFAADVFVLFSFVSFNAFDFLGRLAAGVAVVIPNAWLPAASLSRLVFVPLFLACRSEHSRLRTWLAADAYPLTIMPFFGFTNGYLGSLCMMAGSQKGAWAGTAMALFLVLGLFAGSVLSFLVLYVSTESVN